MERVPGERQGYCGWSAGQLEAEVRNGSWWLVAAAPSVILSAVRGARLRAVSSHDVPQAHRGWRQDAAAECAGAQGGCLGQPLVMTGCCVAARNREEKSSKYFTATPVACIYKAF